ncbi:tRNA dimethylallyltransferase 9-like isoform X2 [Vigna umbellata]|uniref:tRNA dimethylallyltransferase 9-like isoform X2 n=1 Tax=Vigna umbellata TaxID=87088 RepID=UPI001F5F485B|nr:tRNA dimethylallyltransferase 9-like isoform X2 [Vigna umbellata]
MINNGVCTLRTCFRFPGRSLFPPLQRSFTFRRRFLVTASQRKKKEKVIVISGPTGSGKSRLALELAKSLNGEIVSADSVQVYRGLDVGSAKPSPDERKEVPHHLVDILHPSEDYSAGQFFEDARQATRCILDNGRVPIVVGGTGLYLRWFIYGKPDVPKSFSVITSEVNQELAELQRNEDWDTAVQLVVKAGDPKAQFLAVNDWYRLRRSLEIIKEGMGFCLRLSGFLIRVFIQTPILQLKQLVTDKPWSTYKDAESKGVRVLLQSFTNSCLNFKKHHGNAFCCFIR